MYKILVTGFEPFAGLKTNVSGIVASSLDSKCFNVDIGERAIGSRGVRQRNPRLTWSSEILTVDSDGSRRISDAIMSDSINDVDAIIHLGLARGASIPRIESRGLNSNSFMSPDNQGRIVNGEIIIGGPSEIPVSVSLESIQRENLKYSFEFSNDAGGFVCNETLFHSLYALEFKQRKLPCIFVHLPSEEFMSIENQIDFISRISAVIVQPRHLDVVGAIFAKNDSLLASKRKDPKHSEKWEFPGGKIEMGETEELALIRECKEELDWDINPVERIMVIDHHYSDFTVTLHFWRCISLSQNPPATHSHSEHRWIKTSLLSDYDWLDADIPLIEYLQSGINN